jgi:GMP synthase (glutamine-hydrolysing)
MRILLIDNGTTLLNKLKQLIPGDEIVHTYDDFDKDTNNFDLVILSGGSKYQLVRNENVFEREINFIRNTTKPVIGICFGYELITLAFGATLKELPENKKGIYEIEIIDEDLGTRKIKVFESHRWVVDRLPGVFDVLAISEDGPEIIKHKEKFIYGLQFHPENFTEETEGDELFLKLLSQF